MKNFYPEERYKRYESIRSMTVSCGALYGDKTLFKYLNSDNEVEELSYKRFSDNVISLGSAFCSLGLTGKKIALLAETRPEWLQVYMAAICAGAVIVPLDKELMPEQLCEFISYAECEALFCSETYSVKYRDSFEKIAGLKYISVIEDKPEPVSSYEVFDIAEISTSKYSSFSTLLRFGEMLLSAGNASIFTLENAPDALASIIFTSGTTGSSKSVMLSSENICACVYASANMTPFSKEDVILSVLPLHHTYETCCGMLTAYCVGITICLNNSLKYVMKNLKRFSPTAIVLVPLFVQTIYKKILDEVKKKGKEKTFCRAIRITKVMRKARIDIRRKIFGEVINSLGGRLKTVVCGGAPLDAELVEHFDELGILLQQGYGITECAPLVSVNPYNKIKYGSVGLPIPCCEVKISVSDSNGKTHYGAVNEVGEVIVKGDNVMLGYFKDSKGTEDAFTADGYFKTGDLGYFDADGFLFLTGRKKNLIILSNGKNVYPEEIEEYLLRIDLIKECAVLARNNAIGETVVTAIIYPDYDALSGLENSEIQNIIKGEVMSVNKKLPSFKQIRNIEIKKNEFEKTTTQKIKRYKL